MIDEKLILTLPIPPSKNRMFTVRYDYNIKPRLIHTNAVREYYEICQLQYFSNKRIDEFKAQWNKLRLVRVIISFYLKDMRRDTHGMLPVLLDTLEKILGINDRYFIVTERERKFSTDEKVLITMLYEMNQFLKIKGEINK